MRPWVIYFHFKISSSVHVTVTLQLCTAAGTLPTLKELFGHNVSLQLANEQNVKISPKMSLKTELWSLRNVLYSFYSSVCCNETLCLEVVLDVWTHDLSWFSQFQTVSHTHYKAVSHGCCCDNFIHHTDRFLRNTCHIYVQPLVLTKPSELQTDNTHTLSLAHVIEFVSIIPQVLATCSWNTYCWSYTHGATEIIQSLPSQRLIVLVIRIQRSLSNHSPPQKTVENAPSKVKIPAGCSHTLR